MRFKKYVYLSLFKNTLLRVKFFLKRFYIKRGKPLFFNSWSSPKRHLSLQEIADIAFRVFGKKPEEVQFFSQSKFGLCSYKIFYPESEYGTIKCRECFSEDNAQKIEELTAVLNKSRIKIAPVLRRYKHFIFLKWINGETIKLSDFLNKSNFLEKLVKYQASIHSCPSPKEFLVNKEESQYLDFLKKRLIFFGSKYTKLEELQSIIKIIEKMAPPPKPSITHPDFTVENIILEQGEPILIDNETLNIDTGYEYDIINAQRNFFPYSQTLQNYYLSLYKKYHSAGTLESNFDYWELIYILRLAGSRFQEQDWREGKKFVNILKKKLKKHTLVKV